MRFSVIIPLYNKADHIAKSVSSVFQQDFKDYELIIVDDGSSDGSGDIAMKAIQGTNTLIIRQSNQGVSTARNNGVANSHGDYICFLDADDWWDSEFLSEMDALIERCPDAGIYGLGYYYVKNGKARQRVICKDGYINYFKVYSDNMQMPLSSISVAIPRPVFVQSGGFSKKLKLGEDFKLWAMIATRHRVAYCSKPHAYYNQDIDSGNRATRNLQTPDAHFLWNLEELEEFSHRNDDLKVLLDKLRVYAFLPYMARREFRAITLPELKKIDWSRFPISTKILLIMPAFVLRCRESVLSLGSKIKQTLKHRHDS